MTRKSMIMIIKMKNRLTDKARTDRNQEPPNTTLKTVIATKTSSTDVTVKNITPTDILKVTTMGRKTMMICGDCNEGGMVAHFSCFYAYPMEFWRFSYQNGWEVSKVGLSVFGKVIVGSIASGGLELFVRKSWDRAFSCHLQLPEAMHMFICTNTIEPDSCFEAGWNENNEYHFEFD